MEIKEVVVEVKIDMEMKGKRGEGCIYIYICKEGEEDQRMEGAREEDKF